MVFDTVYYSGFWYSRFLKLGIREVGGPFLHSEMRQHLRFFRLLALFFPRIYVPRTHLHTQVSPLQWEIPHAVFATRDVAYLRACGSLVISVRPGLDAREDTARILDRTSLAPELHYAARPEYLERIPETVPLIVDSEQESIADARNFPAYGRWLEVVSRELSREFSEIVKDAHIAGIPFFHERFATRLRDRLASEDFEQVWRDTNSLYLTTAVPGGHDLMPFFDPRIESHSYRLRPYGVDRYLFHPESLRTFLSLFLTPRDMMTLLTGPIDRVLADVSPGASGHQFLRAFRYRYGRIAEEISRYLAVAEEAPSLAQTALRGWFTEYLDGTLAEQLAIAGEVAADMGSVGGSIGGPVGLVGRLLQPAVRHGGRLWSAYFRRRRNRDLFGFLDLLKATLKKVR